MPLSLRNSIQTRKKSSAKPPLKKGKSKTSFILEAVDEKLGSAKIPGTGCPGDWPVDDP